MNETLKTIAARKSVRLYRQERVSDDDLLELVKAGMAAPSAVDCRPWEFICITDREILARLSHVLPYSRMAQNAAAAIVVCGDIQKQYGGKDSLYWILDCCAASENILLAAESLGLGAVWTAVYPERDRIAAIRDLLRIPEHVIPLNVIPVGFPSGKEKSKNKFDDRRIHRNTW